MKGRRHYRDQGARREFKDWGDDLVGKAPIF